MFAPLKKLFDPPIVALATYYGAANQAGRPGPAMLVSVDRTDIRAQHARRPCLLNSRSKLYRSSSTTANIATGTTRNVQDAAVVQTFTMVVATPCAVDRFRLDGMPVNRVALPENATALCYATVAGVGKVFIAATQSGHVYVMKANHMDSMIILDSKCSSRGVLFKHMYRPDAPHINRFNSVLPLAGSIAGSTANWNILNRQNNVKSNNSLKQTPPSKINLRPRTNQMKGESIQHSISCYNIDYTLTTEPLIMEPNSDPTRTPAATKHANKRRSDYVSASDPNESMDKDSDDFVRTGKMIDIDLDGAEGTTIVAVGRQHKSPNRSPKLFKIFKYPKFQRTHSASRERTPTQHDKTMSSSYDQPLKLIDHMRSMGRYLLPKLPKTNKSAPVNVEDLTTISPHSAYTWPCDMSPTEAVSPHGRNSSTFHEFSTQGAPDLDIDVICNDNSILDGLTNEKKIIDSVSCDTDNDELVTEFSAEICALTVQLSFATVAQSVIAGNVQGQVYVWRVPCGRLIDVIQCPASVKHPVGDATNSRTSTSSRIYVGSMAVVCRGSYFSENDELWIGYGSGHLFVYDLETHLYKAEHRLPRDEPVASIEVAAQLAVLFVLGGNSTVSIWSVDNYQLLRVFAADDLTCGKGLSFLKIQEVEITSLGHRSSFKYTSSNANYGRSSKRKHEGNWACLLFAGCADGSVVIRQLCWRDEANKSDEDRNILDHETITIAASIGDGSIDRQEVYENSNKYFYSPADTTRMPSPSRLSSLLLKVFSKGSDLSCPVTAIYVDEALDVVFIGDASGMVFTIVELRGNLDIPAGFESLDKNADGTDVTV